MALVGGEEEGLVLAVIKLGNHDRAAACGSKRVHVIESLRCANGKKEIARVEGGIADVLPCAAVHVVGAALCDYIYNAAQHGAVFRVVGVRNHLHLLDGIEDGRNSIGAFNRPVIVQSIHQKEVAAAGLSIDGGKRVVRADSDSGAETAVAIHSRILPHHDGHDAWGERKQ